MKYATVESIKNCKNRSKVSMITAYDSLFARLFDGRVDIILVGDSLSMSCAGNTDTLPITLDEMIYHTKMVCRGAKESLIVLDMPFGSYTNAQQALDNGIRVYKETGAHAIKLEGGVYRAPLIKTLTQNGIAVMGHIGLMPQFVRAEGGYKIKGKDSDSVESMIADARAVEEAGAFCMVVEGVKPDAARQIAEAVTIPVIGIGSGADVDGQVLVFSDMLGLYEEFTPKFVRKYLEGANLIKEAVKQFDSDIKSGAFPSDKESY